MGETELVKYLYYSHAHHIRQWPGLGNVFNNDPMNV